jgi:aromatic ring-opening dioxygenase catalytic subunit (LigB family)
LLENEEKPGRFYDWFGSLIQKKLAPKAIVIITAHWQPQEEDTILGKSDLVETTIPLMSDQSMLLRSQS